jgi:ABC-2 type transport system ATP-binding protein
MGRTVLISSHILTEMADFCSSVGIVEQGRLLASGRVNEILGQLQSRLQLIIEVAAEQPRLIELLKSEPAATDVHAVNGQVTCGWTAARDDLPDLHRRIVRAEIPLVSLSLKSDNLEDIYMRISGHRTS